MAANPVPCSPWTTDELVRACCPGLLPDFDLTSAIQFASAILFRLSGRQFPGACTQTLWPCQGDSCSGYGDISWGRFAASDWHYQSSPGGPSAYGIGPSVPWKSSDGSWSNCWSCGDSIGNNICSGSCHLPWLTLPGPILSVEEIVISGDVLDPFAYVIENRMRVGRIDGGSWPCSNDLTDLTLLVDAEFSIAVSGTSGTWDLIVVVDGTPTPVTLDAADDAASVQAKLELALGSGAVVVTGGPADASGSAPFIVTFSSATLGASVAVTSDTSLLFVGLAPGSTSITQLEVGSVPGDNAWYVTYTYGKEIPLDAQFAASKFACQIALAQCGSENCVLPARLKEITREGVEMAFADPLEFIGKGEVGIYEVDLWLHSVNPAKIQRRSSVYRADAPLPPKRFT